MTRLKELRQQRNLNQSAIAEVLHVKQNTISNWEKGKTEISNGDAITLADYFGVSVDYLLGRDDAPISADNLSDGEKQLISLIKQLTDEETEELSNFVDFILSKRKG